MDLEGQPDGGGNVDVSKLSCGCKYHLKFGICIHALFTLQIKYYTADSCQPFGSKKRRQPAKTAKTRTCVPAVRPRHNGHALSLD
ncbi:hypothetical protein PHMEG_00025339 [Phytophthora megakarya]|uniref:SWIM-type domain-containing protein n=1 Tax=Phytophthora megakarya TaxID=4795 RepID=A0A225VBW0_9STRA|nr:hypothetical protein PHMEG_00025339 [Phytophthora megakarya]